MCAVVLAPFGLTPPGEIARAFVAAYARSLARGDGPRLTARELQFLADLAAWSRTPVYYSDMDEVIRELRLLQSSQRSCLGWSQLDGAVRDAEAAAAAFKKLVFDFT